MAFTAQTEHDCQQLSRNQLYTSLKWDLTDYVLMRQFYERLKGKFTLSGTNIECQLSVSLEEFVNSDKMSVGIRFADENHSYSGAKIIVSIINENGAKLISGCRKTKRGSTSVGIGMIDVDETLFVCEHYLHNGTLTLFCEIINTDPTQIESIPIDTTQIHDISFDKNVQKKLTEFVEKKELWDVTIVVKDTTIFVNKVILAANSSVFEAMFTVDMKEKNNNTVMITDIDVDTFQAFMRYMYTGTIEGNDEQVNDLLVVADKYQVVGLIDVCKAYIAKQLNNGTEYYWRQCTDKKEYTSFTWNLSEFSVLREFYENCPVSFTITNTNYKCELDWKDRDTSMSVFVRFPEDCVLKFKVIVSFIDLDDKKLETKSMMRPETVTSLEFRMGPANPDTNLHNGTLRILCELIYVDITPIKSTVVKGDGWSNQLQRKFELYFNDKCFCDVTVVVDNAEIRAHKVILAANSPVFKEMFSKNTTEQLGDTVRILDGDATSCEAFLKYMYTGSIDKSEKLIRDLLILADKYQVLDLVSLCKKYIEKHLNSDAVSALMQLRIDEV